MKVMEPVFSSECFKDDVNSYNLVGDKFLCIREELGRNQVRQLWTALALNSALHPSLSEFMQTFFKTA